MPEPRVLIVVPTLGTRPELLRQCVDSIAAQDVRADVVIVAPSSNAQVETLAHERGISLVPDPGSLPSAINLGVATAAPHHEYVNWLGDDDLLEEGSLAATVRAMDADPSTVLSYGACRYIDAEGRELWVSRAGPWAARILKWGPDLIPQPGMLVRRAAWEAVGGVNESMRFAFDLDLLLKIQPLGRFVDVGVVVSSFRWHGDSLTVSDRTTSLRESRLAKRRALSPAARRFSWLWEGPVDWATRLAAREVNRRAQRARSAS